MIGEEGEGCLWMRRGVKRERRKEEKRGLGEFSVQTRVDEGNKC